MVPTIVSPFVFITFNDCEKGNILTLSRDKMEPAMCCLRTTFNFKFLFLEKEIKKLIIHTKFLKIARW